MATAASQQGNKSSSHIGLKTVLVGAAVSWFVYQNRFLFGLPCPPPDPDFEVLTEHAQLDHWLQQYKGELGDDYNPYRNHCLRVLSYARRTLKDTNLFDESANVLGIAVAHHDIALWTDGALAYLEPSAAVMARANHSLTEAELHVAHEIVMQHHKLTPWRRDKDEPEMLVNAIRTSDWTDFSYGVVRFGFSLGNVCEAYRLLPDLGFHDVLNGMGARLHPDSFSKRLNVLKIFKW